MGDIPGKDGSGRRTTVLSGPDRLKVGRRTSQAEGSGNGPDRLKAQKGGPDMIKVPRVVQLG